MIGIYNLPNMNERNIENLWIFFVKLFFGYPEITKKNQ